MTSTPIHITQHGANNLISRGKLKLLKIMLLHCKNGSNKHIRSSMINHTPLNQLHTNNVRPSHTLKRVLTLKNLRQLFSAKWRKLINSCGPSAIKNLMTRSHLPSFGHNHTKRSHLSCQNRTFMIKC
jgi:hypothetical protein